ncbi:killer toxin [Coprinopsis marcescibilis]|uniref:Killer toxin n=1 Tax=Coprinopsis marcescibilis TaxID=230819 RepID=A0A5C3L2D1_COPMA|nr:killer toxin [Coprinopsis marcescibilis]
MKLIITMPSALLLFAGSVLAIGPINCVGSANCATVTCRVSDILAQANQLPDSNIYPPGQHIVCCGGPAAADGLCAFTQNTSESISGARAKELIQALANRGCTRCGRVPIEGNDVTQGEMTVNWVAQR